MRTFLIGLGLALAAPSLAAACPEVTTGVTEIQLSQATLGTGYAVDVVAGGDVDLSDCGYPGGFVITPPDFSFYLEDVAGTLNLSVDSVDCDPVLLANAPDGSWWWDDDSAGDLQPALEMDVTPGRLDVWVGTYDGALCQANLVLSQ